MGWQKASEYNWRALVESDIARWKCVIGDGCAPKRRGGGQEKWRLRRRAEPHARARTPGVCPDRVTRNTGRAQCVHTTDPCNTAFGGKHTMRKVEDIAWGLFRSGAVVALFLLALNLSARGNVDPRG